MKWEIEVWILENENRHACACGCGEFVVPIREYYYKGVARQTIRDIVAGRTWKQKKEEK